MKRKLFVWCAWEKSFKGTDVNPPAKEQHKKKSRMYKRKEKNHTNHYGKNVYIKSVQITAPLTLFNSSSSGRDISTLFLGIGLMATFEFWNGRYYYLSRVQLTAWFYHCIFHFVPLDDIESFFFFFMFWFNTFWQW